MTQSVLATIDQALHDAEMQALRACKKSNAHAATHWLARIAEIKVAQDAVRAAVEAAR